MTLLAFGIPTESSFLFSAEKERRAIGLCLRRIVAIRQFGRDRRRIHAEPFAEIQGRARAPEAAGNGKEAHPRTAQIKIQQDSHGDHGERGRRENVMVVATVEGEDSAESVRVHSDWSLLAREARCRRIGDAYARKRRFLKLR